MIDKQEKRRKKKEKCLHRCGQIVDLGPYYKHIEKGVKPDKAWDQSLGQIQDRTVHGLWKKDILAGKSGSSRYCPLPEALYASIPRI